MDCRGANTSSTMSVQYPDRHPESESSPIDYLDPEYFWVYVVSMPIICVIGLVGNSANLTVLSTNGQKGKFKGFMFTYMRLLSVVDLVYLLFTLQVCTFTALGYYLTVNSKTSSHKGIIAYIWVFLTPLWNTFEATSDLIVLSMTVCRYSILRKVEEATFDESKKKYFAKVVVWSCLAFSFIMHIPYFFQFGVATCQNDGNATQECWSHVTCLDVTSSDLWQVFGYVYMVVIKVIPVTLIIVLNMAMIAHLRKIWQRRKNLKDNARKRFENDIELSRERSSRMVRAGGASHGGQDTSKGTNGLAVLEVPKSGIVRRKDSLVLSPHPASTNPPITSAIISNINYEISSEMPSRSATSLANSGFAQESVVTSSEFRMSVLLVVLTFTHAAFTLPASVAFFLFTNFPDVWLSFDGRGVYNSVANLFLSIKFSKNFFLYFATNRDVRRATMRLVTAAFAFKMKCST